MKTKQLLWLLILIPIVAFMGCEGDPGPMGPAGTVGTDGVDGTDGTDGMDGADGANGYSPAICLDCHSVESEFVELMNDYNGSGHKAGLFVGYAGGRDSCSKCHSKQGFLNYALGIEAVNISNPVAIDCATCHTVHPGDFGLRLADGVSMIFDETVIVDFGDSSNLCANCHQSRRSEPNVSAPADSFAITSTHYGPHHGSQANVLEGVGFAEIAGDEDYPSPGDGHANAGVTCVTCHMHEGDHMWHPSVDACTSCHGANDDFDIHGFQTATQVKLDILRDRLVELGVVEYVDEDEAYEPVVGTYPMAQAQAFFNWIGLAEDRSKGAHNPSYVDALLENTIDAIAE